MTDCERNSDVSKTLTEQWKKGKLEIIGKKFGNLTVLEFDHKDRHYHRYYKCVCDCGNETVVNESNLKRGLSKSCGCGIIKALIHRNKYAPRKDHHKYKDYSLYRVWSGIKKRCFSKTEPAYPDYGGRGITVCNEWKNDYEKFLQWSLENGYKKGLTIDRIDNNGNYCPENCRSADLFIQANNKRNNIIITYKGITDTLPNWARKLKISANLLYSRYYKNKDPEYIFRSI